MHIYDSPTISGLGRSLQSTDSGSIKDGMKIHQIKEILSIQYKRTWRDNIYVF